MQIKFTISSNINFAETTFPYIINSLLEAGVPPEDIYFFIGGYREYSKKDSKVNMYHVPHNSIDFTGLISVQDLNLKSEYWFLLHDTCTVGKDFYKKLHSNNHTADTIRLSSGMSMNIGAYKQEYLDSINFQILEFKNQAYDPETINQYKTKCVDREDTFLRTPNSEVYCKSGCTTEGPLDFYKNGVPRVVEYYSDLDLYKIKANWVGKDKYELNL